MVPPQRAVRVRENIPSVGRRISEGGIFSSTRFGKTTVLSNCFCTTATTAERAFGGSEIRFAKTEFAFPLRDEYSELIPAAQAERE
jgi:hypothetical protein